MPWLTSSPGESRVALRKESVDRNVNAFVTVQHQLDVALRKESVDRNVHTQHFGVSIIQSLSARRAWIEIFWSHHCQYKCSSLSARRAWIEILRQS